MSVTTSKYKDHYELILMQAMYNGPAQISRRSIMAKPGSTKPKVLPFGASKPT